MLIENGVLVGYMQDRLSSKHFATSPSGNGRRQSFRHEPLPRMTNTFMAPGKDDPEEITSSVGQARRLRQALRGRAGEHLERRLRVRADRELSHRGRQADRARATNLIGNGPDVLRKVTMLGGDFELSQGTWTCGKDGQSVPVGIGTPTMKIAEITVGGTKTR